MLTVFQLPKMHENYFDILSTTQRFACISMFLSENLVSYF
jgi:hypothetical protein